ncbi:hypothetical protein C9374_005386 [Naegleria lovaniensis]|uniref:Chromate transporter n=1 Tax=Naegleria lovaniensis TaxID=51637 RepID=A0AA88GJL4_NAELO|nr:uncharacterized protein C9374_005386 [Naegleria lovaniensis]KAG2382184.1 hypothetical protein C9374_005386 [Naegleria lovaniensis]
MARRKKRTTSTHNNNNNSFSSAEEETIEVETTNTTTTTETGSTNNLLDLGEISESQSHEERNNHHLTKDNEPHHPNTQNSTHFMTTNNTSLYDDEDQQQTGFSMSDPSSILYHLDDHTRHYQNSEHDSSSILQYGNNNDTKQPQFSTTSGARYINPYDNMEEEEVMSTQNNFMSSSLHDYNDEREESTPNIETEHPLIESKFSSAHSALTPNLDPVTPLEAEENLQIETGRPQPSPLRQRSFGMKIFDLFIAFFPFGFISFGGPVANVGLLEEQFVFSKRWISDKEFTELFALSQAIPGTASTQIIVAIGTLYLNSYLGGIIAFVLYSLPSVTILLIAGEVASAIYIPAEIPEWAGKLINGFSCGALAIVINAAWKLTQTATSPSAKLHVSTTLFKVLMVFACALFLLVQKNWMMVVVMFCGAFSTVMYSYFEQNFILRRMKEHIPQEELQKLEEMKNNPSVPTWKKILKKFYMYISTFWKKRLEQPENDFSDTASTLSSQEFPKTPIELHSQRIIISTNNNGSQETPQSESEQVVQPREPLVNRIRNFFSKFGNDKPISGVIMLCSFCIIFLLLFIVKQFTKWKYLVLFEGFYRMGSAVFGGGITIVQTIHSEFVTKQPLITQEQFTSGSDLMNSLPGPLFNFSAFVGAVIGGWKGGLIAWSALFLPGFFFIWGLLPLWRKHRENPMTQKVLAGITASAIGFVYAAILLLWKSAVGTNVNASVAVLLSLCMHSVYSIPPPISVAVSGVLRFLLYLIFKA